jgi:hypothetical protein
MSRLIHELHRRDQLWIARLALIVVATAAIAILRAAWEAIV